MKADWRNGSGWPDGILPKNRINMSKKESKAVRMRRRKWIQDNRCHYCRRELSLDEATLDHILPKSKGGRNNFMNLVLCCQPCNSAKGDTIINPLSRQEPGRGLACMRCGEPVSAEDVRCIHEVYWLCPDCLKIHQAIAAWAERVNGVPVDECLK